MPAALHSGCDLWIRKVCLTFSTLLAAKVVAIKALILIFAVFQLISEQEYVI